MYKVALAAALLSHGCGIEIPGEKPAMSLYPVEIDRAVQKWSKHYNACSTDTLTIAVLDGEEFNSRCGEENVGCHVLVTGPGAHSVLIMRADRIDRNTITHEAIHWLASCSGDFENDNPEHDDPILWGDGGILERVNVSLGLPNVL
jgi:hypothetical protein